MGALANAGWRTLTLAEYATDEPSRSCLLTFDDGYASLAEEAYPFLGELGFTATTFLVTAYIGTTNEWYARYTSRRLTHLSWDQLSASRPRGLDSASHAPTHPA